MKKTFSPLLSLVVVVALASVSHAAITYSGGVADDLNPAGSDPNDWDDTTIGYVGFTAAGGDGDIVVTPPDTLLTDIAYIGYHSGKIGSVTVNGTGAAWHNTSYIYVGEYGDGTVNVLDGGELTSGLSVYIANMSGSTGTMLIDNSSVDTNDDPGGGLLVAGNYGTGDLTIQNGGTAVSYKGRVGYQLGSSGTATVTGSGSSWETSSDFHIGTFGSGEFTISDGGQVSNYKASIGYQGTSGAPAEGTVTVTGTGSQWNHTGTVVNEDTFYIARGNYTTGSLLIEDGGLVTTLAGTRIANKSTASATVEVDGGTWTEGDYMHVGSYGTCTFSVTNGGVVNNNWAAMGRYSGADTTATVSGTGSELNVSTRLYVGHEGTASLTIGSGALVTAGDGVRIGYEGSGDGELVVDGGTLQNADDYIMIGTLGSSTGFFEIKNGGQVINAVRGILGYDESANGTATVTGIGSQWINNDLRVGEDATGELTISSGGYVYALDHIHIGQHENGDGTVTVTGSGSSLSTPGRIMVGNAGVGVLNINNSATATARDVHVDDDQSGTSSGTISFSNGTLEPGTLFADVHNDLTGTGTVNANGLVADVAITLDNPSDLTATFTGLGTGGNVTINLDAAGAVPFSMGAGYTGAGSLTLSDGVVLTSTDGHLAYQSTATATATVTGDGTIWYVEDDLDVGRYGAATLEIGDGGLVSVDDALTIDRDVEEAISGAVADSYINMSSGAMLAVLLGDGETLDLDTMIDGDVTHLRWWNDSISNWDSITNAVRDTDYTLGTLTVGALDYALLTVGDVPPPGDYDLDGDVDEDDFQVWRSSYGMTGAAIAADGNKDGIVDAADYTVWRDNLGTSSLSSLSQVSTVPEPQTLLLAMGCVPGILLLYRRRNDQRAKRRARRVLG